MTQESIIPILEELKKVLLEEKEALIQQEGQKIQALVSKKEIIAEQLEQADFEESEKEEVHALATAVKDLQETNVLLTEQAMSYTDVFLSAFQKEAQKNNTYSKEGDMNKSGKSGIIDQSL